MLDRRTRTVTAPRAESLVLIVPDDQYISGASMCAMLETAGVKRMCFPESQREIALSWQAKMLRGASSLSVPDLQPMLHRL